MNYGGWGREQEKLSAQEDIANFKSGCGNVSAGGLYKTKTDWIRKMSCVVWRNEYGNV